MDDPDAGCLNRFETWYALEMPRVFRYVSYRVRDRAAAEDLTARACEQALHSLHRYDPRRGDFNGWMFSIARNVVRLHFRELARSAEPASLEALPDLRAPGKSPEEAAELTLMFREALRLMPLLTDDEQEAIALRYGAELSNHEIAAVMDITPNHVGVLLHRGLKTLRRAMTTAVEVEA